MKFSAKVSTVHSAPRVKGPEAADVDNKVCIAAFQQLLSNSPWMQKIIFPLCSASRVATVWKNAADTEHACTLCCLARGSTPANWLSSTSSAWLRFTRAQFSVYWLEKNVCHDDVRGDILDVKIKFYASFMHNAWNQEHCTAACLYF